MLIWLPLPIPNPNDNDHYLPANTTKSTLAKYFRSTFKTNALHTVVVPFSYGKQCIQRKVGLESALDLSLVSRGDTLLKTPYTILRWKLNAISTQPINVTML